MQLECKQLIMFQKPVNYGNFYHFIFKIAQLCLPLLQTVSQECQVFAATGTWITSLMTIKTACDIEKITVH